MRRVGELFEAIASFENLYGAYVRARRGKRERAAVDHFSFDLKHELLRLRQELLDGSYRPGPFFTFLIHDPKERLISAAPFRDRVVHHAVIGVLEPHLERSMDPDSYACRKGLGLDAALARAQRLSKRSEWVLKSDIEKCFPSIDHDVLKALLARRFKDPRLLDLLGAIIDHGRDGGTRKAMPIGSLTSQWLVSVYLGVLDVFVRQELRPRGYLRYMDDFALLDDDRERLKEMRQRLETWVARRLRLRLNGRVTHIHSTRRGWPFLGFRVRRDRFEIRRTTWRRLRKNMGRAYDEFRRGRITLEELVGSVECRMAHLERASTRGLRRKELKAAEL